MIDTQILVNALVLVEENHLNPDCLSDTCDHPDDACPEYSIGCGDAAEIASFYNQIVQAVE